MYRKVDYLDIVEQFDLLRNALKPWIQPGRLGECHRVLEGRKPETREKSFTKDNIPRLIIVLSGRGKFLTVEDGSETIFELKRGDSLFLAPFTWICPIPDRTYRSLGIIYGSESLYLSITQRTVRQGQVILDYKSKATIPCRRRLCDDHLLQLLRETEIGNMEERYLKYLLEIYVRRCWDVFNASQSVARPEGHHVWQAVCDYILEHWSEPDLSRDRVAEHVGVHPNHLSRIFRKYGKVRFNTYLNEVRLSRSLHMLEESNYSVTDVAALCGYTDLQYFIRCFHKRYGHTPGQLRKRGTGSR